jgi:hypothetical protein
MKQENYHVLNERVGSGCRPPLGYSFIMYPIPLFTLVPVVAAYMAGLPRDFAPRLFSCHPDRFSGAAKRPPSPISIGLGDTAKRVGEMRLCPKLQAHVCN